MLCSPLHLINTNYLVNVKASNVKMFRSIYEQFLSNICFYFNGCLSWKKTYVGKVTPTDPSFFNKLNFPYNLYDHLFTSPIFRQGVLNRTIYIHIYIRLTHFRKRKFIWKLILKGPFNSVFSSGAVEEIMCLNNQIIICRLTWSLRDWHAVYITNQVLKYWRVARKKPQNLYFSYIS
jgi:hypothetical protein